MFDPFVSVNLILLDFYLMHDTPKAFKSIQIVPCSIVELVLARKCYDL